MQVVDGTSSMYKGPFRALRQIWTTEGWPGWYRGFRYARKLFLFLLVLLRQPCAVVYPRPHDHELLTNVFPGADGSTVIVGGTPGTILYLCRYVRIMRSHAGARYAIRSHMDPRCRRVNSYDIFKHHIAVAQGLSESQETFTLHFSSGLLAEGRYGIGGGRVA